MIYYKRLISASLLNASVLMAFAQNGVSPSTNSPYTRYGFGLLSDQGFGNNKAMGGIGYGLRNGFHINASNPASYSMVDSLTFIFDTGFSLQNANFKENQKKTNVKNASFDYIAVQYRLYKKLGMTVGFVPYATVGYNFQTTKNLIDKHTNASVTSTSSYEGSGGIQQVFVGLGYNLLRNLSIGFNASYLYGDIDHSVSTSFSNANAYISVKSDEIAVRDYKLDFGLQYTLNMNQDHRLTIGAVYGLGHKMNAKGYRYKELKVNNNGSLVTLTYSGDTIRGGFELPQTLGAGFTYHYKDKLTIGTDFTFQQWGDTPFFGEKNQLTNRKKISAGLEYLPNKIGRSYYKRIYYRTGAYYSQPYTKINGQRGAQEYGVSIGVGLPIFLYNYKSFLNLSGQYIHVKPKVSGMLEENYLRINIGLTFNERWFMKWKVD